MAKSQARFPPARVRLAKTAKVVGDILHEVLAIEAGAHIEGQLRRLDEEPRRNKPEGVTKLPVAEKAAG